MILAGFWVRSCIRRDCHTQFSHLCSARTGLELELDRVRSWLGLAQIYGCSELEK